MIPIKHYGDITKISGYDVPAANVVIGGSPCQDLSVAGKRAGLSGERSGLFMEQIRIIKEMREKDAQSGRTGEQIRPRFMVWENVCFSGETIITTSEGPKRIDEVKFGDSVLTHMKRYGTVLETYKTENVNVFKLSAIGMPDTVVTKNHPVLAGKIVEDMHHSDTFDVKSLSWYRVDELDEGFAIAVLGADSNPEIPYCPGAGYRCARIKSITDLDETRTVYNLSVGGDNSYVANGFVVHNCGAFSVNDGRDFAAVLEETIRVAEPEAPDIHVPRDGWTLSGAYVGRGFSVAWRVLYAQFWGVPQRRRRIALVADFAGGCAPKVLFESNSLHRHIKPCEAQGQGSAGDAADRSGESGEVGAVGFDGYNGSLTGGSSSTLGVNCGMTTGRTGIITTDEIPSGLLNQGAEGIGYADEQSPTLRASQEVGVVYPDVARSLTARNDGSPCIDRGPDFVVQEQTECSGLTNRGFESGDVAETLRAESHGAIPMVVQNESAVFENHSQDSRFRGPLDVAQPVTATYSMGGNNQPLVVSDEPTAFAQQAFGEYKESDAASTVKSCDYKHETDLICAPSDPEAKFWDGTDVASTLTSNGASGNQRMPDKQNFNAVIQPEPFAVDVRNGTENPDVNGTLHAKSNGGTSLNLNNIVRQKYIVRRLTVLECNRLQGFPEFDKVDVREMTKDEYIAWNLAEGNILTDPETGKVFATRGPGGVKLDEPVELKGSIVNGYRVVSIRNHDVKLQCRVHRVIWISVHGVLPDGYVIDHINNDKQDNRICNLQLLTPADNSHKAKADGRYKTGLESKTTKLDPELHEKIAYLYAISPLTQKQLGSLFGVSKSRIGQIVKKCAWVDIGDWYDENGKLHKDSDSAKYRALGNSIAIPPWLFVLGELNQYCDDKAMASLFSGIDGFPLIWSYLNGKENCVWSSEIEPYCVALSKKYFPDESETAAEQISE